MSLPINDGPTAQAANAKCPCRNQNCKRHGNCEACAEFHHHHSERYPLTTCERRKAKKAQAAMKTPE